MYTCLYVLGKEPRRLSRRPLCMLGNSRERLTTNDFVQLRELLKYTFHSRLSINNSDRIPDQLSVLHKTNYHAPSYPHHIKFVYMALCCYIYGYYSYIHRKICIWDVWDLYFVCRELWICIWVSGTGIWVSGLVFWVLYTCGVSEYL